jgi:ligand-binding sensor domain-containing protein
MFTYNGSGRIIYFYAQGKERMKHIALILIIGCVGFCLWGAKWETITNTTHIYDLLEMDTGYYMGTWGGLVFVPKLNTPGIHLEAFNKVWTTADGLVSNDVRNISYIQFNQSIWLGSASDGITIINQQGMQKLTTELGLPSNNVVKIVEKGSNVLVATQMGLANYYYLEGVNFPLQLHQYNVQNTPGLLSNNINAMELPVIIISLFPLIEG